MLLINPARNSGWMITMDVVIPGGKVIDITPWIQSFTVPSVTLSSANASYGPGVFKTMGDTPQFDSISARFILDENWEIMTILYGNLFAQSRASAHAPITGNCTLFAMDTYNVPRFKFEFANMVITNVQSPTFNTEYSDDSFVFDATFEFSGFKFRKIGTAGEHNLGSGPGTHGMFKGDGIGSAETYNNDADYKVYEGKLFKMSKEYQKTGTVPVGYSLINGEPWHIDMMGDNFMASLATTQSEQVLNGNSGNSGNHINHSNNNNDSTCGVGIVSSRL
jgi:hypothetical protein